MIEMYIRYIKISTISAACSPGEYRSEADDHTVCRSCPSNTMMNAVAAPICDCRDNYFRCDGEGPEMNCTSNL